MSTTRHIVAKFTADTSSLEQGTKGVRTAIADVARNNPFKDMAQDTGQFRTNAANLAKVISGELGGAVSRVGGLIKGAFSFGPIGIAIGGITAAIALAVRWYQKQGEVLDQLQKARQEQHADFEKQMAIRQAFSEVSEMRAFGGTSPANLAKAEADANVMAAQERVRQADALIERVKQQEKEISTISFTQSAIAIMTGGGGTGQKPEDLALGALERRRSAMAAADSAREEARAALTKASLAATATRDEERRAEGSAWSRKHQGELRAKAAAEEKKDADEAKRISDERAAADKSRLRVLDDLIIRTNMLGMSEEGKLWTQMQSLGASDKETQAALRQLQVYKDRKDALEKDAAFFKKQQDEFNAYWANIETRTTAAVQNAKSPLDSFREQIEGLNELFKLGRIDADVYWKNVDKAKAGVLAADRPGAFQVIASRNISVEAMAGGADRQTQKLDEIVSETQRSNELLQRLVDTGGLAP